MQERATGGPLRPPYGPKAAAATGTGQSCVTAPEGQIAATVDSAERTGTARSADSHSPQSTPAPNASRYNRRAHSASARKRNGGASDAFAAAKEMVTQATHEIRREFGHQFSREECQRLVSFFRAGLLPRRKAGRRPKPQVTAALADWRGGMRGVALYRKHIPGWEKHNRYHRIGEQKELMDAIRSRRRRERKSEG